MASSVPAQRGEPGGPAVAFRAPALPGLPSTPTFVQQPNGMIGMAKQMTVTLTCDHRHIYGADAAKFLKDLAALIENDIDSVLY